MTPSRFLDTNILIRLITNDNEIQSPLTARLFGQMANQEITGVISTTVIFETAFVLESIYKYERKAIARALRLIIGAPGVRLLEENSDPITQTLALYTSIRQLSFADCYHATLAMTYCGGEIYTFDKDFDRVPDLVRMEPEIQPEQFTDR